MADVVFLLGAGFNCSVVDPSREVTPPLARNFFQVLLGSRRYRDSLDVFRGRLFVDVLLEEIERYWKLDLDALKSTAFDIEECLTLFESQLADGLPPDRELRLRRAGYALRNLLLTYLGDLSYSGSTPTARRFGSDVLESSADVLTFNYDTLAEEAIASASGIGPKVQPKQAGAAAPWDSEIPDEDLDASHLSWKPALASSFSFDEIDLPIAGVPRQVAGERYYAHTNNTLYERTRVLKLHGSINWLRYSSLRVIPPEIEGRPQALPPPGLVLEGHANYWLGAPPTRNGWRMESVVLPPQLYKQYGEHPFPLVWTEALRTLSECRSLIVVGYSFPPTDFRTKRLFLEAFSNHTLSQLVVVNPDTSVTGVVRRLTRYDGPAVSCDNLTSLYGLPPSWFPLTRRAPDDPPS